MKMDKEGNLIPENYDDSFRYNGTYFIIDKFDDGWLVSERNHMISLFGEDLEAVKKQVKERWDSFKSKQKV